MLSSTGVVVYVPTHRRAEKAIEGHLRNLVHNSTLTPSDKHFVLLENLVSQEDSIAHAELLKRWQKDIDIIHLDHRGQSYFIERLLQKSGKVKDERLRRILLENKFSYGRNPNLAYLVSAALGISKVIRRDSDVYNDTGMHYSALDMEVEALGRVDTSGLCYPIEGSCTNYHSEPISIVGTGTFGDPTIDRRDLFEVSPITAAKFQALGRPGVPLNEVLEEACEYLIDEPNESFVSAYYDWSRKHIEMECCGIFNLCFQLPEVPGPAIGCDYMVLDLARSLQIPVLYHSVKLRHVHDPKRPLSVAGRATYRRRDIQYIQMGHIWRSHGNTVRNASRDRFYRDGTLNTEAYVSSFKEAIAQCEYRLKEVRMGALSVLKDAYEEAPNDRLKGIISYQVNDIMLGGESIDKELLDSLYDYCYLIERWPSLVASAKAMGADSLVGKK